MDRKVIVTNDGSSTLYVAELDEHYHSIHGAVQESRHVFIESGLKEVLKTGQNQISVLEMGFGTGLNFMLSIEECLKCNIKLEYTGIEKYPLDENEWEMLNYSVIFPEKIISLFSFLLFNNQEDSSFNQNNKVNIDLLVRDFREYTPNKEYDIVYFDVFSPVVQPELWSVEIFKKMYNCLRRNGILVTYCAKGQVRRDLESVGFVVERLPGPPGKREMIRAIKQ